MDEDLALEALLEFLNCVETGIANAKQLVRREKVCEWDPNAIPFTKAVGSKGQYERYPAEGQKAEATTHYKNLLADLKQHNDRFTRNGWFYWLFLDKATIGRKRKSTSE